MKWSLLISIASFFAAVGSAIYAAQQVKKIKIQVESTSGYNLTSLSNQHNWELFDRRKYLPPALPSWNGLTNRGWAWRVLHLNHLNLLLLARQDFARGLMNDSEMRGWILKARYWFQNIRSEDSSPTLAEGRETLKQLLRPEEGYPEEFRRWLVASKIVSSDLIKN